ncbi:MAG: hypothetical protein ACOC8F_06555 [Planctomycetota bacterium]
MIRALKVAVALVVLLALGCGVCYLLASAVPGDYRPADLPHARRVRWAKRFLQRVAEDFHNAAERRQPFDLAVGADELNAYLASMDEIVAQLPGTTSGQVREPLARAELAAPAVTMRDGALGLMVRHTGYNKVLTLRLGFELLDNGDLRIRLTGARVGRLPVPSFLVDRALAALRDRAAAAVEPPPTADRHGGVPTSGQMRRLVARVVGAIDGEPVTPVFGLRRETRVRLTGMDIRDGAMVMHFIPATRRDAGG